MDVCVLSFAIACGLTGPTVAEPPDDAEVFSVVRHIQTLYTESETADFGAAKGAFPEIVRDAIAQLKLDQLTPYQVSLLAPFIDVRATPEQLAAYTVSLGRAAEGDDVHAAIAISVLCRLDFGAAGSEHLDRLLRHPALGDAMNSWFANQIINHFGSLEPAALLKRLPRIEAAILAIHPDSAPRPLNRPSLTRLFKAMDDPTISAETAEVRARVHQHLLRVARSTLAKFAPAHSSYASERYWIDRASDVVEYLQGPASRGEVLGGPAPALEFRWFRGPDAPIRTLAEVRGKVVVLDFWTTWCGACVASFPDMHRLQARYAESPVVIIGVTSIQGFHVPVEGPRVDLEGDADRELELMADFMHDREVTWNIAFSTRPVIDPRYEVWGIPHVTIIDAQGRVRHNGLHRLHAGFDHTVELIDALLREAGHTPPEQPGSEPPSVSP